MIELAYLLNLETNTPQTHFIMTFDRAALRHQFGALTETAIKT